jgi:hypothetical protein
LQSYFKNQIILEKAKPFVKRGRKATGLKEIAGLPGCRMESWVTLKAGLPGFLGYGGLQS